MCKINYEKNNVDGVKNLSLIEFEGKKYYLYLPDNCDLSTNVFIYGHGGSAENAYNEFINDTVGLKKLLMNNPDLNTAFIVPKIDSITNDNYEDVEKLIDIVFKENNMSLSENNIFISGFSNGGYFAEGLYIDLLKKYPDANINSFLIDSGSGIASEFKGRYIEDYSIFKDKNFIHIWGKNKYLYEFYPEAAKAGANIYILKNIQFDPDRGDLHGGTNYAAFTLALSYFLNNGSELNILDIYQIKKYDINGDLIELKTEDEINELINIFNINVDFETNYNHMLERLKNLNKNFFENPSWRWDNVAVASELQDMVKKVESLEYLKNPSKVVYSSSTPLPNAEADKEEIIFINVSMLLSNIENIIKNVYRIQNSIELTEKEEEKNVEELQTVPKPSLTPKPMPSPKPTSNPTPSATPEVKPLSTPVVEQNITPEKNEYIQNNLNKKIIELRNSNEKEKRKKIQTMWNNGELSEKEVRQLVYAGFLTKGLATELMRGNDITKIVGINFKEENKELPSEEKQIDEETIPNLSQNTNQNSKSNLEKNLSTESNQNISNSNENLNIPSEHPSESYNIKEDYPKWEDVYTDKNRLVFESEEGYKVIINHQDNKIIGAEYYYDIRNEDKAATEIDKIIFKYRNADYVDSIVSNGQYIKVIFKEEYYKEKTLEQIQKEFNNLDLVEGK